MSGNVIRFGIVGRSGLGCLILIAAAAPALRSPSLLAGSPVAARLAEGMEEASPQATKWLAPLLPMWRAAQRRVQHLTRVGVDRWHAAGYWGRGVKIAILDSGFRGYRDHLGQALPAQVQVRSFRYDGNLEAKDSKHGILCGEVVHALAPEAELLLANWEPDQPEQFLNAVRWARQEGARIISCSVITPRWSDGEGGGDIHRALAGILGTGRDSGDLLCFASAGNTTERHWSGPFSSGGDGFHEWKPSCTDNGVSPWGDEEVSVELYGPPGADYVLSVLDTTTGGEVGPQRATHSSQDRHSSAVRFLPQPGRSYRARVRLAGGAPGVFHLALMNASLEYWTARSSVCFPADGSAVVAVGAVDHEERRMWYSACGPNSPEPKPDLVAPVPFESFWRERPFGGTSAAAPQAAALAALWWSRYPTWTASRVRAILRTATHDVGPTGHDYETGFGVLRLPQ